MVSVCCEDCRTEKLKSNVFNKILINEHCNIIGGYLGCDTCIKMKPILNVFDRLTSHKQPASTHCFLEPCATDSKGENDMYVQ